MNLNTSPLDFSVPANNQKIIEIYNKMRIGQIGVNGDYQRKLVWKKAHKINFIDTILKNYPFPEVYFAPGSLDPIELVLVDEIVDGQQRLSTIKDYIEETDIFSAAKLPIKKFSELTIEEKQKFLNYEVSVRYLKNATIDQVKEIFARINKTEYSLNSVERLNAQWGDSEFVCFAKQIIEPDYEPSDLQFELEDAERKLFLDFFHGNDGDGSIFTANDMSRMLALQYVMVLVATLDCGEYFSRNEKVDNYVKSNYDYFPGAATVKRLLSEAILRLEILELRAGSVWLNKANLFTLIVEISKKLDFDVDYALLSSKLNDLELRYLMHELIANEPELNSEEQKYFDFAREAVNEKHVREYRGDFVGRLIAESVREQVNN